MAPSAPAPVGPAPAPPSWPAVPLPSPAPAGPPRDTVIARIGLAAAVLVATIGALVLVARIPDDPSVARFHVDETLSDQLDDTTREPGSGPLTPAGFITVTGDRGVSLAVPSGWRAVPADEFAEAAQAGAKLLGEDFDDEIGAFAGGLVLAAIGPDGEANLTVADLGFAVPLRELEAMVEPAISMQGGTVSDVERVALPGGDAVRARVEMPVGSFTNEVIQYYATAGGTTWVITFTGADDLAEPAMQGFAVAT